MTDAPSAAVGSREAFVELLQGLDRVLRFEAVSAGGDYVVGLACDALRDDVLDTIDLVREAKG